MKPCPFCAEEIQDAAIVCKHCGRNLLSGLRSQSVVAREGASMPAPAPPRAWNPGVATVLSLVIPGAGQMYKGQVLNGLAWLFVVLVGYAALLVPGLVLHVCCILGASMGNPYEQARRDMQRAVAEARDEQSVWTVQASAVDGGVERRPTCSTVLAESQGVVSRIDVGATPLLN